MLSKFKKTLLTLAALGSILIGSSRGDVVTNSPPGWGKGSEGYPTGNNPHHYAIPTLVNITQSTFTSPEKMLKGPVQDSFRIAYDFRQSGISFADTNRYFINFSDNKGDNYGVGRFSTNGTGYLDFYVNGQSLNSSAQYLTNGSPMHAVVSDGSNIYGLEKELGYNAQAGLNKSFTYTNLTLGRVIGSAKPLKIIEPTTDSFKFYCFNGVTYDIFTSTNLNENFEVVASPTLGYNGVTTCKFDTEYINKCRFFKVEARIQE